MKKEVNQSTDLREKKNSTGKKQKSSVLGLKVVLALLSVSFVFAGMVFGYYFGNNIFDNKGGSGSGVEKEIVIEEGESVLSVSAKLDKAGLIDDRLVFVAQAFFYEYDIMPGSYVLNDAMTNQEIFIKLEGGGLKKGQR